MEFGKYIGDSDVRKIFESSTNPMGISRLADARIVEINDFFLESSGFERDELLGKTVYELGLYEDLEEREKMIDELKSKGEVKGRELNFRIKGGEIVACRLYLKLIDYLAEPCIFFEVEDLRVEKKVSDELDKSNLEILKEQQKFKLYMDVSKTIFIGIDKEGIITYMNPIGCEKLGYLSDEVIGLNWFDNFIPEKSREEISAVSKKLLRGEIEPVEYYENTVLTKSGEEKIFAWHNTLLKDDDGNIIGHLSSGDDITEKKKFEESLKKGEKEFRYVAENLQEGLWITNSDDRMIYYNRKMEEISGSKSSDVLGLSVTKDFPVETTKYFIDFYYEAKKKKVPVSYEADVVTPIGRKTVQTGWLIPKLEGDKFDGMICTIVDITMRKKAEGKLKELQVLQETILDSSPDVIYVYDLIKRENFYSNEGVSKILGYSVVEIKALGSNMNKELMHPKDYKYYLKKTTPRYSTAKDGEQIEHEYRMKHKDGLWRWLHARESIFLRDKEGQPSQIFGIVSDVTEKKIIEKEMQRTYFYLERAQEIGRIGTWDYDLVNDFLKWTPENYKIFGVPEGTPMNFEGLISIIHSDDREYVEKMWTAATKGEKYDIEHRIIVDGETRWVREKADLTFDGAGKVVNAIGITQDITEKKNAEERLKKSEALLNESQISSKIGSWEWDILSGEINWSDEMFRLMGFEPGEENPSYESVLQRVHPEDREYYEKSLKDAMDKKAFYDINNRVLIEGVVKYMHSQGNVVYNEAGDVVRMFGTVQDITEKTKSEEKFKESESRYRRLFEAAKDAIFILDTKTGKIVDSNPYIQNLLGYSAKELIGKNVWEVSPLKDVLENKEKLKELQKKGYVRYENLPLETKEGKTVHVEFVANVYLVGEKEVIQCNIRDISEKVKALEEVRESEGKYRGLFDSMLNGFALHEVVLDENGKPIDYVYLETNPAFEELTGIPREGLIGRKVTEVLPGIENDSADWIGNFGRVALTGEEIRFQNYSEEIGKRFSVYAYSPKKGQFATIFEDITEKMVAEERLKESEEKHRTLLEESGLGIGYYDLNGKIILMNKKACDNLKLKPEDLVGRYAKDIFGEEMSQLIMKRINETVKSKRSLVYDDEFELVSGKQWFSSTFSSIRDGSGKVIGVQIISDDVTEKKKGEKEIKKSNEILRSVVDSASDMILSIDSKGKIISWNSSAEYMTGYKSWDVLDKNISELEFLDFDSKLSDLLEEESVLDVKIKCNIKSKYGRVRKISFTASSLELGEENGLVLIGHEISSKKSYSLEFGRSYLLKDSSDAYRKYLDTISSDYCSFFVSRTVPMTIQNEMSRKEIDVLLLKENNTVNLELLFQEIKKNTGLKTDCVIFLDRIDYLITLYGFRSFLRFLYRLNDYVSNSRYMLLLNVNSNLLEVAEMAYIEQELLSFPTSDYTMDTIDSELVSILNFISDNKKKNVSTSFKDIRTEFDISNVTTRKRILELMSKGFVEISKTGRLKVIELTSAGNEMISGD